MNYNMSDVLEQGYIPLVVLSLSFH